MNKLAKDKEAENNKFRLPIVFYDIVNQEQFDDYMKMAQQDIKVLKQKQQLESLEILMHFLFYEEEQGLFKQVADIVKQKSTLQQLIFNAHASGEIKGAIRHVMDSISTLNQLKIFEFRHRDKAEDPENQLVLKNTLLQLKQLEYLVLGYNYGKLGNHVENLQYIAEGIKSLKKLKKIHLSISDDTLPLCPKGIELLGQSFSELPQLQEIRFGFYGNKFGDHKKGLESLGYMISQLPQTVQKLELEIANNNIHYGLNNQNQDLQYLADGILKFKNIENLDLKLNLVQNINNSKLEKQEVEKYLLCDVKDKIKNIIIIL